MHPADFPEILFELGSQFPIPDVFTLSLYKSWTPSEHLLFEVFPMMSWPLW